MATDRDRELEALRPQHAGRVMDLVEAAGIDVSQWAFRQDGSQVPRPAANPNYCYEWAFGGNGEPNLLCVWHRSMAVSDGLIIYEDCIRDLALKLDRVAIDRTNPAHVKSRARDQAKRARGFDSLLQRAFRRSEPVRIIILQGEQRAAVEVGWETAKVRFRRLDDVEWYVHAYNDDGSFRVVRGVPPADDAEATEADDGDASPDVDANESAAEPPPAPYLDQFSIPDAPERRENTGLSFSRSAEVRRAALARAAGVCEFCGCAGFKTASGGIYLETHHVVPLAEDGPDVEWNVVAICPNDHRRAHHGEDRDVLFDSLTAVLKTRYPQAREMLESLRARRAAQGAT